MIGGISTNNLLIHLDGIKNQGLSLEHFITSTQWKNLANEDEVFDFSDNLWDKDGLYFYRRNTSFVDLKIHNDYLFSFEICFSINELTSDFMTIVANAQYGGWEFGIENGNRFRLAIHVNGSWQVCRGEIPLSKDDIYYITGTFDQRYIKLYNKGELVGINDLGKEYNMKFPENSTHLVLGANPDRDIATDYFFNGKIYSFRYYQNAITENIIRNNYQIDSKRYPSENGDIFNWVNLNDPNLIIKNAGLIGQIGGRDFYKTNDGDALVFCFKNTYAGFVLVSPDPNAVVITTLGNTFGPEGYICYDTMKWYISTSQYWMPDDAPPGFICITSAFKNLFSVVPYFLTSQQIKTSRIVKDNDEEEDKPISKEGRVKYVRVRSSDGNYSNALAFIVNSDNVDFEDGRNLNEHLNDKALASIYSEDSINLGRSLLPRGENEETIKGEKSAAIGHMVHAEGDFSLATGSETVASGLYSHAEGKLTEASGEYSHAEGGSTKATGIGSHSEGYGTIASGDFSHAEGTSTTASGKYSHAEGSNTLAEGEGSLALGNSTIAKGKHSIAVGQGTIAASDNQFVHGTFNIEDTEGKYLEIIGNGTDDEHRSNAYAITKEGDIEFSGKVTAAEFDGPAIYDIQGQEIADYVYNIQPQNGNELLVTKGSGAEEVVVLSGWENIQEKIGSWSCKNGSIINRSEKKIVNFGYVNRTKYSSACIFYCQLVVYASPLERADSVEINFRLYIDDIEYDPTWNPKETLRKGYHIITLMQPIRQIQPNKELVHMISVKAKTGGGSVSYETGGIRAAFFGMGIDSGDVRWDGKLSVSDNFEKSQCNITFENDDYIHRDYNIIYQEKMLSELVYRTGLIEVIKFNYSDNIFEHTGETINGLHYNITFEDDDSIHKNYDIEYINLMSDGIQPNQDKKLLPDLVILKFKVLGEYNSKYNYNSYYVAVQNETDTSKISDANLLLQQFFSTSSTNFEIDKGRAVSLGINFSQFKSVDTVQVKEVV